MAFPAQTASNRTAPDMSDSNDTQYTPAEAQFHASSIHPCPPGYKPWKICVDYPAPYSVQSPDAPWLDIPLTRPQDYMKCVRDYCFEGMKENNFIPQKNSARGWYHPPWLHPGPGGREPLHGLKTGRFVPPYEISATQHRTTQSWEVSFFNSLGATVFEKMWRNPNMPDWKNNIDFPLGTVRFNLIYTNATDEELPNLRGSPAVEAMIAVQPDDPSIAPDPKVRLTDKPGTVRLFQMDIAVRDDREEVPSGWVFGTFTYDYKFGQGYDGVIPVGLSLGLDPEVTQKEYEGGKRVKQTWINNAAEDLRESLRGYRPFWGWNGRLCGVGDGFISACQSCHSRAQWNPYTRRRGVEMLPPEPIQDGRGKFVPINDEITMTWFSNVPRGKPITDDGAISGNYSHQLVIGYENYLAWQAKNPVPINE